MKTSGSNPVVASSEPRWLVESNETWFLLPSGGPRLSNTLNIEADLFFCLLPLPSLSVPPGQLLLSAHCLNDRKEVLPDWKHCVFSPVWGLVKPSRAFFIDRQRLKMWGQDLKHFENIWQRLFNFVYYLTLGRLHFLEKIKSNQDWYFTYLWLTIFWI